MLTKPDPHTETKALWDLFWFANNPNHNAFVLHFNLSSLFKHVLMFEFYYLIISSIKTQYIQKHAMGQV